MNANRTNSKTIVFVALMAALGNVMFILSQTIFKMNQIALDLSHIGTLIAAAYCGPWAGLVTGLLVGIGPGMFFGYFGGNLGLLGLIGLPLGKALTGLTVGLLTRWLKIGEGKHSSWKIVPTILVGYVPECIFTVLFFKTLVVIFLPQVAELFIKFFGSIEVLISSIIVKAWIEMGLLSFFMGALIGNDGFSKFMKQHFRV